MAAREYGSQLITYNSAEEQAVAADLMAALIPSAIVRGFTPDQAGRDAANQVAQRITQLRRSHEELLIRALRQRGALREDANTPPGVTPQTVGTPLGGQLTNTATAAAKQATRTKVQNWAQEINKERGWNTQQQAPAAASG
jgi:hypothetical protein